MSARSARSGPDGSIMTELRSELLYRMRLEVGPPFDIGTGPRGHRMVIPFKGGRFEGPKLRGEVLITGGDWLLAARRRRHGAGRAPHAAHRRRPSHLRPLSRHPRGQRRRDGPARARRAVPAAELYFRTTPVFETGSEKYAWLNRIIAVGIGAITADGAELEVFQVL